MPRVLVGLIDRIVCVAGYLVWVLLHRTPEVGNQAILVIQRLNAWGIRPRQHNSATPEERLDVIRDISEAVPDQMGHAGFSAEPGERGLECSAHLAPKIRRKTWVSVFLKTHPHLWTERGQKNSLPDAQ
jgi:hypothetical protein